VAIAAMYELAKLTKAARPLTDLPDPAERRRLREDAGYTLLECAWAIGGATPATLSRWERGTCTPTVTMRRPYLKLLSALASVA
jgi:DNA-binding XRE family transcriptional regulator